MEPEDSANSELSEPIPDTSRDQGAPAVGLNLKLKELVFDGDTILTDLDLTLSPGKITCLLGPSGVGKSSILKILASFLPPPESSFLVTTDGDPLKGRISYMDQQDLLLPWATVLDNLLIGDRLRGDTPDTARAMALLDQVGLTKWRDARPDALSGGMRQRVALARSLMEEAPVVLMDEPFSALDAITKYHLQALAARMLAGRTVLLITHDPMEALRLGHVIHVLSGHPARLSLPLTPAGAIPRDPSDDALQRLYSEIMTRLAGEPVDA
ncbi:ATP-binding cassette domain-containing protein [Sneathiella chungangensis]|uniref:ATP-binding cassette domain-containing protein n=1 Tax=Sneathiella chungangensis TaxID=1418234 RepID=A0A845M8Y5_9PROT|nr:ABC transporter ATP-binding protein [Sneathiella chungangensis]MZR21068.1 ATP-binding cassette domain-containing protein [Sneathiella chungangensis]